ncbi:MAG: hypothetical protein JXQ29_15775 [Planctomycetes bacterium]|nr:hypothetical protein [Planctomycetota bacterium]
MSDFQPINDVEFCVVACRRSGHHAVMAWLAEQFPGTPFHVNNCVVGENPFRQNRRSLERAGRADEAEAYRREEEGRLTRKELLILNFEDTDLRRVFSSEERVRRERALGPSRKRYNVLVLRDHYNLLASRIKRVRLGSDVPREDLAKALLARELYVQYAREALDETRHIDEPRIVILYNRWFRDAQYRREISARLNGTYREDSLKEVAVHGEGSSFDGVAYSQRAHEMDVLERWRAFAGNAAFHAIVGGRALRRCTSRLFPEIDFPHRALPGRAASWIAYAGFRALDRVARALRHRNLLP